MSRDNTMLTSFSRALHEPAPVLIHIPAENAYNTSMERKEIRALQETVEQVIKGKGLAVRMAIVALLGRGNLLIEDVPGVGKTTLAFALARASGCTFSRIQFTSDMLPSDIIGVNIFNMERKDFEFRAGPVFANIVLADEINRTNPKTQSALLEAMNEHRVTVENRSYFLPEPFMVIATQNPIDYYGTFPLPESQLDRFMMHLRIGYPDTEHEKQAVLAGSSFALLEGIAPAVTQERLRQMQQEAETVHIAPDLADYLMSIVTATRRHAEVRLGVSTRGAQFLLGASRSFAYCEGRDYIVPDDIRMLAPLVLSHRMILKTRKFVSDAEAVVREIVEQVPVPV